MGAYALRYERGRKLALLDQRKLPHEQEEVELSSCDDAHAAITSLRVRGAPAIAQVAALALALELSHRFQPAHEGASPASAAEFVRERAQLLRSARPTAVNLHNAMDSLISAADSSLSGCSTDALTHRVIEHAEALMHSDESTNHALGRAGADAIASSCSRSSLRVLTHCNTGSLATASFGTALGVVKTLFHRNKLERVYFTETRPYNQGARLTGFECVEEGMPATLLCDSAAAHTMSLGLIDAVVVGADRVACNGDSANKIGTYMLAIAAKEHNIPFFFAAPTSTIDEQRASGDDIVIEERNPDEVTHQAGARVAAEGVDVSNPAFDVTPCKYITAVVTEKGALYGQGGGKSGYIDMLSVTQLEPRNERKQLHDARRGFIAFDEELAAEYAANTEAISSILGGDRNQWTCHEVGDGNINFVYILKGPSGEVALKQALPYVRLLGESAPVSQDRIEYEGKALKRCYQLCPEHTPAVYFMDTTMRTIAMQYLRPPFVILRGALVDGHIFPNLGHHMGKYLAQTLFFTSPWATSGHDFRSAANLFGPNSDMCRLSEQVRIEVFCTS